MEKPLKIITSIDTNAATSILNTTIIPSDLWVSHFSTFGTTSKGGVLKTRVITRNPIMIKFFSGILYRTKLLDPNIPTKDLIISFDIYKNLMNHILILMKGIIFMG